MAPIAFLMLGLLLIWLAATNRLRRVWEALQ